jgi:predicted porin
MKKTLLALTVCSSLIPAAFAGQVELFGNVDVFVAANNTGGQWRTGVRSGGLTASHFGLKGTEDLGGGTQVFFNLDQAFLANNGSNTFNNEGMAFSREANVGVRGKYGQLSLGRQYTPHFLIYAMYDPTELSLGAAASPYFFPGGAAVTGQDGSLVRMDNTLQYVLPTPFGLTNFFFIGLGEHKAGSATGAQDSNKVGNTYNYAAKYDAGKFSGMVSYMYRNVDLTYNKSNAFANQYINAAVSYDFGVTKPAVIFTKKFTNQDRATAPIKSDNFWMAQIGTATPVAGGKWTISGSYLRNQSQSDANAWGLGTKYIYPLSKRTRIYAGIQALWNDSNAGYAIEAGPDSSLHFNYDSSTLLSGYGTNYLGKNVQQVFVGINHAF